MAAPVLNRQRLEAELENLERMLAPWRERLRSEAAFTQQFEALAGELLARADEADREFARARIAAMRAAVGLPARTD